MTRPDDVADPAVAGRRRGAVVHQRLSLQVAELHRRSTRSGSATPRRACTAPGSPAAGCGRRWRRFGPLLDPEVDRARCREELRWLGRVLGEARDPHVAQQRLRELLVAEPADEVAGPVQRRLDTTYAARLAAGEEQLVAALASPRHARPSLEQAGPAGRRPALDRGGGASRRRGAAAAASAGTGSGCGPDGRRGRG